MSGRAVPEPFYRRVRSQEFASSPSLSRPRRAPQRTRPSGAIGSSMIANSVHSSQPSRNALADEPARRTGAPHKGSPETGWLEWIWVAGYLGAIALAIVAALGVALAI
jgi:hypothetical protein